MKNGRDCTTCFYAVMEADPDGVVVRECHRFPPQVVVSEEGEVEQTFPLAEAGMWCGEWRSIDG